MTQVPRAFQATGRIVESAETNAKFDLEPITRMLDASYALIFRTRVADERVEDAASHGVDTGYVVRLREAARERMLPGWLTQLKTGSVIDRAAFGSDHQFALTPFYNHVIRPEGRFHCLIATPFKSQSHRLHLVVGRPRTRPSFDADDMRLFRCTLPLVSEVLRIQAVLADREAALHGALGIFEAWPQSVLVADGRGHLRYANRSARHLLATCDALGVDAAGRIRSNSFLNNQRLWQALTASLKTEQKHTTTLPTSDNARDLCLSFHKAEDSRRDAECPSERVVITVEDHEQDITDERTFELARRHGLTRREADLLSTLTRGVHLKEASRQLNMSYNTGRCHLRQIFGKVQVHRQSDLIRLCATGHLPRPE